MNTNLYSLSTISVVLLNLIFLPTSLAQVSTSNISHVNENYCLDHSIEAIKKSIEDYPAHHLFDDHQSDDFLWITYIKMYASKKTVVEEGTVVTYHLKPYGVNQVSEQPQFSLICRSELKKVLMNQEYAFFCELLKERPLDWPNGDFVTYGISDFEMKLTANTSSSLCKGLRPGTHVSIEATITTNPVHVERIKKKVAGAKILEPVIDSIFKEDKFFANYYVKFFAGWKKRIVSYETK